MARRRRDYKRSYASKRRKNTRNIRSILLTLLIFLALIVIIISLPENRQQGDTLTGPVYVIDGDTVVLNKVHIRLAGIDAPEMQQSCQVDHRDYFCGKDARKALLSEINGRTIRCETLGLDKYERTLGTCYLNETNLNQWMVEQGWAVSYGDYHKEEAVARRDKRGIWAGRFETPRRWREDNQKPDTEPESGHHAGSSDIISDMIYYIKNHIMDLLNAIRSGALPKQ